MSETASLDAYPLSPMQQGMLFHTVSLPGTDVYVEQLSCRLHGALDRSAFEAAWEEMLARHAVLRTAFAWRGLPEPLQVVGSRVRLPLEVLDWSERLSAAQTEALRHLCAAERHRAFDLSRAPLMRLKLVRLEADMHHLVWTWHHAILDAWSVPIVIEEFFTAYAARRERRPSGLPPARPYRDFIAWQRSRDTGSAERFWRKTLGGFNEPTPLGIDRLVPPALDNEADVNAESGYGLQFLDVPAVEIDALREAARHARLTFNTFVQGAWALLISRYSGRDDVLFGTAVAGRAPELAGVETMVGLTINTVPVRVTASPKQRLGVWLEDLQRAQNESRLYEHTPLAEVQGWSTVARDTPLFESLLVFENFPLNMQRLQGGGLATADFDFVERANFPLTVMMSVREQSKLGVGYDRSRFDDATMARMLQHLRVLLADMSGDRERTLADLDYVTSEERRQLIAEFSRAPAPAAAADADAELAISRSFEAQVRNTPDAPAAIFAGPGGDVALSYRELNERANHMARRLRGLGVLAEERVAICMEASLTRLIAILGVIKAGGAYVPLEPASPTPLLRSLIADCGARVVLTGHSQAEALSDAAVQTIALDENAQAFAGEDERDLTDAPGPDNAAYLIYTSGSTGRPKGVVVTHRSLRHLVTAQIAAFQIAAPSRVLQFASLSFDASVSEIFTALLAGACLYMAPRNLLVPSHDLLRLMERWRITTVTIPPSVLSRLPSAGLSSLHTLVSAGEACPAELAARWGRGRRFLNAYGPTEITVCATIAEVAPEAGKPSIGRAIGQAHVYILDSQLRPVPIGVAGHLHVGGPGVARGYWDRPRLTAAGFIPDPFSEAPGARLYRTGDLARFLANGEIEFLGRIDDQVKIRGFRIEPGEIEAAMREEPGVREAAVVPVTAAGGSTALMAYVTPAAAKPTRGAAQEWWPSIAEFFVYDDLAYHAMTTDERRNASYRAAIAAMVKDRVVLEVGTGPEALLAHFCVEAGARKVYAVEMLEASWAKARARVRELGLASRIEVLHGDATTIDLPELAEVCVSEIVGSIGGSEGAVTILNGVRRCLVPAAAMIPHRSTTLYAPVELPQDLLRQPGFSALPARYVARIFEQVGYPFDLRLCVKGLNRSHLLAEPCVFEDLDFTAPVEPGYRQPATFRMARDGMLAGFLVWLTLDTGAGARIDILEHQHCWLPVFLPAFHPGLPVSAGDAIETVCSAVLCDNGINPDYAVEGVLRRQAYPAVPFRHDSRHHAPSFRASPFYDDFFRDGAVPLAASADASSSQADFDADDLIRRLRQRLPKHMVPSRIARLDALPLLPSGKLDRRALLAIASQRSEDDERPAAPPRSRIEIAIARIWCDILKLGRVGLQTNFFDQGGHSLLLLQVQDRIEEELKLHVAVTDLFKYPTVETLARCLAQQESRVNLEADREPVGRRRADARQAALRQIGDRRRLQSAAGDPQ